MRSHLRVVLGFVAVCLLSSTAFGDNFFINLGTDNVFLATYEYTDGNSGEFNEAGWIFHGWIKVEPGEAQRVRNGWYHVSKNGRPVTWSGKKESPGFVKSDAFREHWPRGANDQHMLRKGMRKETFQLFEDDRLSISGTAYRVGTKNIPFKYESRSIKFLNETFPTPGRLFNFNVNAWERWSRNIRWTMNRNSMHLGGSIEGRQESIGAARTPGLYEGTLTVEYTIRQ